MEMRSNAGMAMVRRAVWAGVVFLVWGALAGGLESRAVAQEAGGGDARRVVDFDWDWKFYLGDAEGAEAAAFDDGDWRVLDVPHDWSIEFPFTDEFSYGAEIGYLPMGVGWYRKDFTLEEGDLRKHIAITFDGVYQLSDVWINGQHLGHYPFGYNSFTYTLTPYVRAGENTVAVRVDNSNQPNSRWYSGSGIYRSVRLAITDPLHVAQDGIFVTTPVAEQAVAVIQAQTEVENTGSRARSGVVRSMVVNPQGKEVARHEEPFEVEGGEMTEVVQRMNVSDPDRWSLETPALYTLKTVIVEEGEMVDGVDTRFGIRSLEYSPQRGFLLNGQMVKMYGVNIHHAAGALGAAVPPAIWEYRMQLLKDMGYNAVRTAHNPVDPAFLDVCDRMGILIMNEIFDEWLVQKSGKFRHAIVHGYHNYFDEWAIPDLINWMRRDRNHPSVVMWSVGNEIREQGSAEGLEILRELIDVCHEQDPTRPVTQGCNLTATGGGGRGNRSLAAEFLGMLDIAGYNYIERRFKETYFGPDKLAYPDWVMVGTEDVPVRGFRGAAYSLGDDPDVVRPNYITHMIDGEQLLKFVMTRDYVIGDFVWTGFDYLGECSWPAVSNHTGFLDRCGFPKDGYYLYKSRLTEEPMIHLFPHWNWPGREGQIIPVLANTNCEYVELFINGKSAGQKRLMFPRSGSSGRDPVANTPNSTTTADFHLSWDLVYEPGVVQAVGIKDGGLCFAEIRTAGEPHSLRLTSHKDQLKADRRDAAAVKLEVLDASGVLVPLADNEIEFTVEGPGKLIGVDNGDPNSHRSMKSPRCKAWGGLALAVVQAGDEPGVITVTARSGQLAEATIELDCTGLD